MEMRKKAAGCRPTATKTATRSKYPSTPDPSRRNSTKSALGWLTLYLLTRNLPTPERLIGWNLVAKWLGEMVDLHRGVV